MSPVAWQGAFHLPLIKFVGVNGWLKSMTCVNWGHARLVKSAVDFYGMPDHIKKLICNFYKVQSAALKKNGFGFNFGHLRI